MTGPDLTACPADRILQRIAREHPEAVLTQHHQDGTYALCIDTGWIDLTADEHRYLQRLAGGRTKGKGRGR